MNERLVGQALMECRAAWEAHPDASWGWCVHHNAELEPLLGPIEERISYIVNFKPPEERITRLDNLRPVASGLPREFVTACLAVAKTARLARNRTADFMETFLGRNEAYRAHRTAEKPGEGTEAAYETAARAHVSATARLAEARKADDEAYLAWEDTGLKHRSEIADLHRRDVPAHTWDGATIFAKGAI